MKIFGFVPARMGAGRFPGKPLFPILKRPMVEHVFCRALLWPKWDGLFLCTPDPEIADFGKTKGWPVIMTGHHHKRALDRVAEAGEKQNLNSDDIAICVQGDEPMLHPDMMTTVVQPLIDEPDLHATMLTMPIMEADQFHNPNVLKVIHDLKGNILYTSRAPVPYCEKFTPQLGVKRIYGIFAFRFHFLKTFTQLPESPLEKVESCDSNRLFDHGYTQRAAVFPYRPSFAVDRPEDIKFVESHMKNDPVWGQY